MDHADVVFTADPVYPAAAPPRPSPYAAGGSSRSATTTYAISSARVRIAEPMGADFHIGLPAAQDDRVANVIPLSEPAGWPLPPGGGRGPIP